MSGYLSAGERRAFCQSYLRTLDPCRAAKSAGREDGWALLRQPAVQRELEELRGSRRLCREDALGRLAELAFGRANDAVALALAREREELDVAGLDLSAVSEFRVTDKGGVELRFLDRVKALETLCALLDHQDSAAGAEAFLQALEGAEDGG